jgi:adenosylhomocysteine nucleosidase
MRIAYTASVQLTSPISADRPLIVVALREEAVYLKTDLPVLFTGVGKVRAALAVAQALASGPLPTEIINLGTAGALHPGMSGTYEVSRILEHDFDAASIFALTGHSFGEPIELGGAGPVLATGDVFVSDPVKRAELASHAQLVDMEAYSVAAAGLAHGVRVRVIKHVSDDADGDASASWTTTVDACARALADWLDHDRAA